MNTSDTKVIQQVFKSIEDAVAPTMGARGRFAIIEDDFSNPYLTDDGVTVAREAIHQDTVFKRMIAQPMIEAAHNTERLAYDGTTLTVLLTSRLYSAGLDLIKHGMHPQIAAKTIEQLGADIVAKLKADALPCNTPQLVASIAYITTKMPAIGELVAQAYDHAGADMNVIITHDRSADQHYVEHVDGMVINEGFFTESFLPLCNCKDHFHGDDALCFLLSEGDLNVKYFVESITPDAMDHPFVFFVHKDFNPETLGQLIEGFQGYNKNNQNNKRIVYSVVMINEDSNAEELFLDLAAKTNGKIQSHVNGTYDYVVPYAGLAKSIDVYIDKTIIVADGDEDAIKERVDKYKAAIDKDRYFLGNSRFEQISRRIASLTTGCTKIALACKTITEFRTIRFKLDDAIGAVACACKHGFLPGAGKELYLIANNKAIVKHKAIADALKAPAVMIVENAGFKAKRKILEDKNCGLDVTTGNVVDLIHNGIIDSEQSIECAVTNSTAIVSSYLKAFILIAHSAK